MQRCRHMATFHPGKGVAGQGKPVPVDIGTAEPRAWGKHQHSSVCLAARVMVFRHTPQISVVANGQRDGASSPFGESVTVRRMHIEPGKAIWQVCGMIENTVPLKRARHSQPHSTDLFPGESILA